MTGLNARLSRRALRAFQQAERGEAYIYISAVVLWEISRLEKEGAIRLNESYEEWVTALLAHPCFECVPLDEEIIAEARHLGFNRDVFDAAVVATARVIGIPKL